MLSAQPKISSQDFVFCACSCSSNYLLFLSFQPIKLLSICHVIQSFIPSYFLSLKFCLSLSLSLSLFFFGGGREVHVLQTTVEPRCNEDLGTMEITLLYQGNKTKKNKELGPAKLPCYNRVLFKNIRPLYNEVSLYLLFSQFLSNYYCCQLVMSYNHLFLLISFLWSFFSLIGGGGGGVWGAEPSVFYYVCPLSHLKPKYIFGK